MRVNVYGEELTDRVEIVQKVDKKTYAKFIGVRFYLESSSKLLPPQHPDDDSSAVTLWIKSGKKGFCDGDETLLVELLEKAVMLLKAQIALAKELQK